MNDYTNQGAINAGQYQALNNQPLAPQAWDEPSVVFQARQNAYEFTKNGG